MIFRDFTNEYNHSVDLYLLNIQVIQFTSQFF